MKRQSKAVLAAAVMAISAFACFKDPVSNLQGSASRVSVSRRILQQNIGDTDVVNVQVLDAQGNPLALSGVAFASLDPTVADVAALPAVNGDTTLRNFPGNTLTKIIVFSKSAGQTRITIAANGVTDTLTVTSYPTAFTGTTAPAAIHVGDTVTVTAPAGITFGPTANIAYTSGAQGFPVRIVSRNGAVLKFVPTESMATAGKYTVTGGVLLGTINLPALVSAVNINVLPSATEPADNASAGARNMGSLTAANDSVLGYGEMDAADPADYYKFTMVNAGTVSVQLNFSGTGAGTTTNPDLDVVVCTTLSATGTCTYTQDIIPGNGASNATQPEAGTTSVIAAGTTVYVRIYYYDPASPQRTGYRLRVKTP